MQQRLSKKQQFHESRQPNGPITEATPLVILPLDSWLCNCSLGGGPVWRTTRVPLGEAQYLQSRRLLQSHYNRIKSNSLHDWTSPITYSKHHALTRQPASVHSAHDIKLPQGRRLEEGLEHAQAVVHLREVVHVGKTVDGERALALLEPHARDAALPLADGMRPAEERITLQIGAVCDGEKRLSRVFDWYD